MHNRDSKIFFHPAKFYNFKDEKISDFKTLKHKAKTCWTENWRSSGIINFLGEVFLCFGGQKFF